MNTAPANLRVSDTERAEAISIIQAAYADGRLDEPALERHLELAFASRTRLELHHSIDGLRRPGTAPLFAAPHTHHHLPQTAHRSAAPATLDPTAAGLTHLSALPFSFFGPGVIWLCAGAGTPLKREAAKALNFQVIIVVAAIVAAIVGGILNVGFISGLVTLAWLSLTILSGVKAFQGRDWTNPVTAIVDKRLVSED